MKEPHKISGILFVIFLLMMTLPFVFLFVPSSRGPALFGIQPSKLSLKSLSLTNIVSHKVQDEMESKAKQSIGFCNHAVRFNNELNYKLFHYSSAPKLVLGRDDYFYENIYIDEYTGKDFIGTDSIRNQVRRFKSVQEQLQTKGVALLLVISPSKARFMPEYLPKGYQKGKQTNYDDFVKELHQQGVDFLDLNSYFIDCKATAKHPLYSRHGIHWSTYGMWTAAGELQQFIQSQCHRTLNRIIHQGDSLSTNNKDLDFDLEPPMNLMRALSHEELCFPIMQLEDRPEKKEPAFIIADSYFWSLWDHGVLHNWFDQPLYWYYNQTVYPDIWYPADVKADKSELPQLLESKKIIIIATTTANLKDLGWGILGELESTLEK